MARGVAVRVSRARLAAMRDDPSVTFDQMAAELGIPRSTLSKACRDLGLPSKTRRRHDHDAIARMWTDGLTSLAIGNALGCHPAYVRVIAQRMGLPLRAAGRGAT